MDKMDIPEVSRVIQGDLQLHSYMHVEIERAERKLKQAKSYSSMSKVMIGYLKEMGENKALAMADIIKTIDNFEQMQAEDTVNFYNDLHDKYFPDGIKMSSE
jgi:hypothetical protein